MIIYSYQWRWRQCRLPPGPPSSSRWTCSRSARRWRSRPSPVRREIFNKNQTKFPEKKYRTSFNLIDSLALTEWFGLIFLDKHTSFGLVRMLQARSGLAIVMRLLTCEEENELSTSLLSASIAHYYWICWRIRLFIPCTHNRQILYRSRFTNNLPAFSTWIRTGPMTRWGRAERDGASSAAARRLARPEGRVPTLTWDFTGERGRNVLVDSSFFSSGLISYSRASTTISR